MTRSPIFVVSLACAATVAASQLFAPTASAVTPAAPEYRVQVDAQQAQRTSAGLIVTGRLTNTGRRPLVYTQVTPLLMDSAGKVLAQGRGYLTVSPLPPGQSAEFRACEPIPPAYANLQMRFREAGHPVAVDNAPR